MGIKNQTQGSCGEMFKGSQSVSFPVPRDDTTFVKAGATVNQMKHKDVETFPGCYYNELR